MPASPKSTEEKINRHTNAWETLAPANTFGGMTLTQFKQAIEPSHAVRREIEELETRLKGLYAERDEADDNSPRLMHQFAAGVLADPEEGPDSALYEAFGYTRTSARKSGLTRKGSKKPTEK